MFSQLDPAERSCSGSVGDEVTGADVLERGGELAENRVGPRVRNLNLVTLERHAEAHARPAVCRGQHLGPEMPENRIRKALCRSLRRTFVELRRHDRNGGSELSRLEAGEPEV